jgi:glycosyltransferase involved in cell wall biosynthesis
MTGRPASLSRCRVVLVVASLCGGGAERVMVTLSQHLDRKRFETHMAVASAKGPLLGEVPPDVVVHDLKASRVRYCIPGLLRLIWQLRPAAILSTSVHVNVPLLAIRALLPRGTKIFVRENNTPSAEAGATGGLRWKKFLYHWFYGHANAVICQSEVMLDDLCEQFDVPRKKMVCIYNPVDGEQIRRLANDGPNPFIGSGPHLVAGGRLEHAKGFDILLEAMVEVRRSIPLAQLSILGAGVLDQDLRHQCARLGLNAAITFAGFRSNPFPYYANADLFVLSSRYEGLPNVMLEAMTLHTPVVATDCPGGVREIVEGWPNCRLAPPEDASALAEAILASLRSKRQLAEPPPDCCFSQTMLSYAVGAYENLLLS